MKILNIAFMLFLLPAYIFADNVTIVKELTWQDSNEILEKTYSHNEAKKYCSSLRLNNLSWELPTINQLLTIVDYYEHEPAINKKFIYKNSNKFWSSTKHTDNKKTFWYIDFMYGYTYLSTVNSKFSVRCVNKVIQ